MKLIIDFPGRTYTLVLAEIEEQSEYWEAWYDMTRHLALLTESSPKRDIAAVAKLIEDLREAAWKTVRDVDGLPAGIDKANWLLKPPLPVKLALSNNLAELVNKAAKSHLSETEGNVSGPSNAPGSSGPQTNQLPDARDAAHS